MKNLKIKKSDCGISYYETLPVGWKKAVIADFYRNGKFIIGMAFLVHGFRSLVYEGYRTSYWTDRNELFEFIRLNRVWILE